MAVIGDLRLTVAVSVDAVTEIDAEEEGFAASATKDGYAVGTVMM